MGESAPTFLINKFLIIKATCTRGGGQEPRSLNSTEPPAGQLCVQPNAQLANARAGVPTTALSRQRRLRPRLPSRWPSRPPTTSRLRRPHPGKQPAGNNLPRCKQEGGGMDLARRSAFGSTISCQRRMVADVILGLARAWLPAAPSGRPPGKASHS